MLTGAAVIVAVSLFFNGTALPMVATIALCALAAFTLSRFTSVQRNNGGEAGRMMEDIKTVVPAFEDLRRLSVRWNEFQICCVFTRVVMRTASGCRAVGRVV